MIILLNISAFLVAKKAARGQLTAPFLQRIFKVVQNVSQGNGKYADKVVRGDHILVPDGHNNTAQFRKALQIDGWNTQGQGLPSPVRVEVVLDDGALQSAVGVIQQQRRRVQRQHSNIKNKCIVTHETYFHYCNYYLYFK